MNRLHSLTLVLAIITTAGCIRLAGSKTEEKAELPTGDPVTSTEESSTNVSDEGTFKVKFETTAGDFIVLAHRDWAPIGAEHFHKLVSSGFYDECRFFRVVPGFMVQFGLNGDPKLQANWREKNLQDEPVKVSNKKTYVTYAKSGAPNSRTTQIFINYADNAFLDGQGFSPFAEVVEGMDIVEQIESKYQERPDQGQIQMSGNAYLKQSFPDLDYIKKATIMEENGKTDSGDGIGESDEGEKSEE